MNRVFSSEGFEAVQHGAFLTCQNLTRGTHSKLGIMPDYISSSLMLIFKACFSVSFTVILLGYITFWEGLRPLKLLSTRWSDGQIVTSPYGDTSPLILVSLSMQPGFENPFTSIRQLLTLNWL